MPKPYMKGFLSLLMMFVLSMSANAADIISLTKEKIIFNKNKSIQVFTDTSEKGLDFKTIRAKKFSSYSSLKKYLDPKYHYWGKYQFKCKDPGDYYFYFGQGEQITVYSKKGNGGYTQKEIGEFTPRSEADVKSRTKSAKFTFAKGESAIMYVQINNETNSLPKISLDVTDAETYQEKYILKRLSWQAVFHGALWIMILYNVFLWFTVGDRSHIIYALYMFVLSLTFFLIYELHYHIFIFLAEYPEIMYFVEVVAGQLSIILYFLFMQKMVNTKELIPFWHKVSTWWILLKILALPALVWYNTYKVLDNPIMETLLFIDFGLLLSTCIVLLFKKDKVARYFAIGSIILAVSGLISIINRNILGIDSLNEIVQVGIISQIIVFSMGLGHKTRRNASLVFELQKQNEELVSQLKAKVNEQEKTLRLFMRYVPEPVVAKALNKTGDETIFDGELRYVTAMFCDVRGFTTISEELKPREVVGFLNDFYSVMTVVIKKYGGSVNQFIGDEIFAVFGAPLSTSNNEQRAVLAALEMVEKVKYLNEKYQPEFHRPIHVGIGLNAGEVVAGNLGSEEKIGYSVVGDPVNTAKRIEGLTKAVPNSIIISEDIYRKVAPVIHVKELEEVLLKGKKRSFKTYMVLGKK
ncbi:MAG: class 3 adenylate cyclase [Maribacter sp.]|jgi:class 3 adenylate cyclase